MIKLLIPLLTTLFIYLKLVGSVTWSWVWVLSPLWVGIPAYLFMVLALAYAAVKLK